MAEVKKEGKIAEKKVAKVAKLAVIRIRGRIELKKTVQDTLDMISLRKVNWATVVDSTPVYLGMIKKAKDYITWGEIDEETFKRLVEKWGRKAGDEHLEKSEASDFAKKFMAGETTFNKAGLKPVFKLHPPSKGYERGGIKHHLSVGGSLGYRGKEINALLAKMAGLKK